jgi:xanthine dehydrogenase YagR molybdenum-binding subunit
VAIELIEVQDKGINPLGVKGVGEVGQVGVAAAIANAVFNATGRRIRELPIAAELVMDPTPVSA